MPKYRPRTTHAELGSGLFDPVKPAAFPQTILRYRNQRAAASVGLDELSDEQWVAHFGRFEPLAGSFAEPLALRYHGHQFRSYNPDLGDGRGFLYAQLEDLRDGRLLDLGTKGSGRTPWSRGGDGRLTLKGGVREVLATAMLEALGVNTSKSLSLIETGEELQRGDEPSPTRSSVLVRLSHSHVRIGSFQRLAYLRDDEALAALLDHSVQHYYPELWQEGDNGRAAKLLGAVSEKVAQTGARWIAAGFVHGVLNTDNINITGESFDYGPWRFLPTYDPGFTAAYFDQSGLYAFGRQPDTLAWNLTRLAEVLLPLGEHAQIEAALNRFWPAFQTSVWRAVLDRLGLQSLGVEQDSTLVQELFNVLHETQVPFEQFFFDWRGGDGGRAMRSPFAAHYRGAAFETLAGLITAHPPAPNANLEHPYFVRETPRTMLIEDMEALWAPIAERDDWRPLYAALGEIEEMREAYSAGS
ncbi:protein adenylyltransferase SelO [Devosia sp.]|uniref:protein adenylyltransferase SelO n=1 Tax=Devosia sp. TaxID=1871048 RepID=UPI0035B41EA2